jgi:hypothetical protein
MGRQCIACGCLGGAGSSAYAFGMTCREGGDVLGACNVTPGSLGFQFDDGSTEQAGISAYARQQRSRFLGYAFGMRCREGGDVLGPAM